MKLSVFIITYNHQKYITQAIESALNQETSFDYEIVIGDDCSTDGTREILQEFEAQHPGKIRVLYHDKHVGMHVNFWHTYEACRGQYLAILEGDDYWTSPAKLQRQVDFLDKHEGCVLCFHRAHIIDEWTNSERLDLGLFSPVRYGLGPLEKREFYGVEDILQEDFIPPCSIVLRNGLLDGFPKWLSEIAVHDWPIKVLCAERGQLGYIDDTLAAYRLHAGSIRTGMSSEARLKNVVVVYQRLNEHFNFRYDLLIRILIAKDEVFEEWVATGRRLTTRIQELTDKLTSLWDNYQKLTGYCQELSNERAELQRRIQELGKLADERAELYQQNQALSNDLEALRHRNEVLEQEPLIQRIRDLVRTHLPSDGTVLVVSKGDDSLLNLDGRRSWHFPQAADGTYLGYYPADSAEAITLLEASRSKGGDFLLFPKTAFWWLEHYGELRHYLEHHGQVVAYRADTCLIISLRNHVSDLRWADVAPEKNPI